MSKYIDAEKLIAELRRQKRELELSIQSQGDYGQSCQIVAYENILSLIASLQQEQPEPVKGKFVFPKLLYARTLDNKTIDVSYGPQDMTSIEYVRNDFVEQEQPDVDLEKEIFEAEKKYGDIDEMGGQQILLFDDEFRDILRHFYELGLNAIKEE